MGSFAASIPHLANPARFVGGQFALVEQDTTEHVLQCATAILSAAQGSVLDDLAFGIADELFAEQPLDISRIQVELERQEPRAAFVLETHPDALNRLVADVGVSMRSRTE